MSGRFMFTEADQRTQLDETRARKSSERTPVSGEKTSHKTVCSWQVLGEYTRALQSDHVRMTMGTKSVLCV